LGTSLAQSQWCNRLLENRPVFLLFESQPIRIDRSLNHVTAQATSERGTMAHCQSESLSLIRADVWKGNTPPYRALDEDTDPETRPESIHHSRIPSTGSQ
jgi:hypothetical protein